jgi:hypothetical protein
LTTTGRKLTKGGRDARPRTVTRSLWLLALLLFCAPLQARAQDAGGNPSNWCRNGAFASDAKEFKVARVKGTRAQRAYFYGDDEGCPGPDAKCRRKAYVVAGDALVVSRAFGEYVCAWFQPARGGETVGWIRSGQLEVSETDANPAPALWLGEWELYSNSLRITRGAKAGTLRVEGEAFWHGVNPGNVHTGEVGGEAAPDGNVLTIGDGDDICRATLRLVGPHLIVDDNNECGGANVTFDGVYRKKK